MSVSDRYDQLFQAQLREIQHTRERLEKRVLLLEGLLQAAWNYVPDHHPEDPCRDAGAAELCAKIRIALATAVPHSSPTTAQIVDEINAALSREERGE